MNLRILREFCSRRNQCFVGWVIGIAIFFLVVLACLAIDILGFFSNRLFKICTICYDFNFEFKCFFLHFFFGLLIAACLAICGIILIFILHGIYIGIINTYECCVIYCREAEQRAEDIPLNPV